MTNKDLQDLAWRILPVEFREEVKKYLTHYRYALNTHEAIINHIFGKHNLTSDAEGEEMLTVSRKEVIRNFKEKVAWKNHHQSSQHDRDMAAGWCNALHFLFGSKCLPDEKPTTQFKIGDKVRAKGTKQIGTIKEPYSNDIGYRVYFEDGDGGWDKEYQEDELIPYTEPTRKEAKENENAFAFFDNTTSTKSDDFDSILKDSFHNERRLNIATRIMAAMLSNQMMLNNLAHGETTAESVVKCIVDTTMMYTDALIAECEKGGSK